MEKQQKYANLIITNMPPALPKRDDGPDFKQVLLINGEYLKGSFHVNCAWISPGPNDGVYERHVHPHDEMIGFIGTNPDDPHDLCAEAELWIEDEVYHIKKSFLAFFPKGVVHCPLWVRNVTRPILHFDIQIAEGRPEFKWVKELEPKK